MKITQLPKTELDAKIDQYWNMKGNIKHYNYSFTPIIPDTLVDEYYIDPELEYEYENKNEELIKSHKKSIIYTFMEIRDYEKKFIKRIEEIVSKIYPDSTLQLSTDIEDTTLSFDMKILNREYEYELSVRIRKNKYKSYDESDGHPTGLTIRNRSKNGFETEIDKLIKGMGKFYFYGIMNEDESDIESWNIIDINKIRNKIKVCGKIRYNKDTTELKTYSIKWLKDNDSLILTSDKEYQEIETKQEKQDYNYKNIDADYEKSIQPKIIIDKKIIEYKNNIDRNDF